MNMVAFSAINKKFCSLIITTLLVGSFTLYAVEQNQTNFESSRISQVSKRISRFQNLSLLLKDYPEKQELINSICDFETNMLALQDMPPGGNSLVIMNNNPASTDLYVACQDSETFQWINFTTQEWVGSPQNYKLTTGANVLPLLVTSGSGARFYVSTQQVANPPPDLTSPFIWDFLEYTTGQVWDTSAVDAIGIPMAINYNGYITGYRQYPRNWLIGTMYNSISSVPPYNGRVPASGNPITRILAPKKYLSEDTTCLSNAISNGLADLAAQNSPFSYNEWTYSNFNWTPNVESDSPVNPGVFTATCTNNTTSDTETVSIGVPPNGPISSYKVLATQLEQSGDAAQLNFAGMMTVALVRGVGYDSTLWGFLSGGNPQWTTGTPVAYPWKYYITNLLKNFGQFNVYSQVVHLWSYNAMNYGTDHDDFYNQSSSMTVPANTTAYLYIPQLAGNTPNPTPLPLTWPNPAYSVTFGVPPPLFGTLGEIVVNHGQWVLPNPTLAGLPSTGLPQSFIIQFTGFPTKELDITLRPDGTGTVTNASDWTEGGGITINTFNIGFPSGLYPN